MPRKRTMQAWAAWVKEAKNVDDLIAMVASGTQLQKACLLINQPWNLVHPYLHSTPELQKRYEEAKRAYADRKWEEKLEVADKAQDSRSMPAVAAAKLKVEVLHEDAVAWNRERYGQTVKVQGERSAPGADQALLGFATELLRLVKSKEPRLIGSVIDPVIEPDTLTLPAPKESDAAP